MRRGRFVRGTLITLAISAIACATALAASNYGTKDDPLITKSYVDQVFKPALIQEVKTEVDATAVDLQKQIDDAVSKSAAVNVENFTKVTLGSGQTLSCHSGTEFILRDGSARCAAPSSVGLMDVTYGTGIDDGDSLEENHLYMVSESNDGLTARSSITVLVRGAYTLG